MDSQLQEFGKNVFVVQGPPVFTAGFRFSTHAVVVKLHDGSLWMCGPVELSSSVLEQIHALGPVKYLVAQTPFHVWRLAEGHRLFPEAQLWSCPQVARAYRSLPLAGIIGDKPAGWEDDLDHLLFAGSPFLKEIVFFHKESHTLLIGDLIQSHMQLKNAPFQNILPKIMGVAAPRGGVAIDIRLSFNRRDLAKQSLRHLLDWDFDKLILAHDRCIDQDAKGFVEQAFRWLLR